MLFRSNDTATTEIYTLSLHDALPILIIAASQIIDRNPNPSRAEIRHGLEGNLCRCTGYQHIVEAVEYAAKKKAGL